MTTAFQKNIQSIRQAIAGAADSLPLNYDQRREGLAKLSDEIRAEFALRLESPLNDQAASMPSQTYDDKKTLAKFVNAELRRFGLAIRCPVTGLPALLQVYPGNYSEQGRFRLSITDAEGQRKMTVSWMELPALQFMPDELTRMPYGHGRAQGR